MNKRICLMRSIQRIFLVIAILTVAVSCNKEKKDSRLVITDIEQSILGDKEDAVRNICIGVAKEKTELKESINAFLRDSLSEDIVNSMITDAVMRNAGESPGSKPIRLSDEAIHSSKLLRIACDGDNAPMSQIDSVKSEWSLPIANDFNSYVSGADIEIIKKLANALKTNVVIFKVKRNQLVNALKSGAIDLVVSSFSQAKAEESSVDFTIPYYKNKVVMITRDGSNESKFNKVEQFKGLKVIASRGSIFEDIVDEWSHKFGIKRMSSIGTNVDLLKMVSEGSVDALFTNYPTALNATYQKNDAEYTIYTLPDSLLPDKMKPFTLECIGISKGSPLKDRLDKALTELNIDREKEKDMLDNARALCRGMKVDESKAVVLSDEARNSSAVLKISLEGDNIPLNFTTNEESAWTLPISGQSGQYIAGIDVEIAKMIANQMKVGIEIYKMDFDAKIPAITSGFVDAAMTLSPTEKRKMSIDFSMPYFHTDMSLFLTNVPLAKSRDLRDSKGLKIVAKKGAVHEDLIPIFEKYGAIKSPSLPRTADLIVAVKSGVADAAAMNQLAAEMAVTSYEKDTEIGFWGKVKILLTDYWKDIINGVIMTLVLALLATTIALLLGLLLALGRELKPDDTDSKFVICVKNIIKTCCDAYVGFFRGTPLLVQAMIIFFGIPIWADIKPVYIFGGYFLCALLVMALHYAAYMCEIIRGGILSLDKGQTEGAVALGLTRSQTCRHILIPQALQNTMPAILNEYIVSLKDSSILNVIGLTELYGAITIATNVNYFKVEGYVIVAVIYLILTLLLSFFITVVTKKMVGDKIEINPFKHTETVVVSDDEKLL